MTAFLDQSPGGPETTAGGEARTGDEVSMKIYYTGRFLQGVVRSVLLFLM
jgi:hypothetical protein